LTSLTAFYNEMIGLEDKGRRVDAMYLASGKVPKLFFRTSS